MWTRELQTHRVHLPAPATYRSKEVQSVKGNTSHRPTPRYQATHSSPFKILCLKKIKKKNVSKCLLAIPCQSLCKSVCHSEKKMFERNTLLGYYAAYTGNALPTFRDNLPVLSQSCKKFKQMQGLICWLLKMGRICCPEMSVRYCHHTLRNIPQERRSHLLRGRSLKSNAYLFDKICHIVFSRLKQDLNIIFYFINTFTAIVDLSRSNFWIARAPLLQLKSAT